MEVYYERLSRYSVQEIKEAFNNCLDKITFFPKIAEVVNYIEDRRSTEFWLEQRRAAERAEIAKERSEFLAKLRRIRANVKRRSREQEEAYLRRKEEIRAEIAYLENLRYQKFDDLAEQIRNSQIPAALAEIGAMKQEITELEPTVKALRSKIKNFNQYIELRAAETLIEPAEALAQEAIQH